LSSSTSVHDDVCTAIICRSNYIYKLQTIHLCIIYSTDLITLSSICHPLYTLRSVLISWGLFKFTHTYFFYVPVLPHTARCATLYSACDTRIVTRRRFHHTLVKSIAVVISVSIRREENMIRRIREYDSFIVALSYLSRC